MVMVHSGRHGGWQGTACIGLGLMSVGTRVVILQFPNFVQSGAGSWANRPDKCTVCVCIGGWTFMNVLY